MTDVVSNTVEGISGDGSGNVAVSAGKFIGNPLVASTGTGQGSMEASLSGGTLILTMPTGTGTNTLTIHNNGMSWSTTSTDPSDRQFYLGNEDGFILHSIEKLTTTSMDLVTLRDIGGVGEGKTCLYTASWIAKRIDDLTKVSYGQFRMLYSCVASIYSVISFETIGTNFNVGLGKGALIEPIIVTPSEILIQVLPGSEEETEWVLNSTYVYV